MPITKTDTDPMQVQRNPHSPRTVTQEDADAMKSSPGQWFTVNLKTQTRSNVNSMSGVLRRSLPSWYGGQWELTARQGTLFCRFIA